MNDDVGRREIVTAVVKCAAVAFLLLATFPGDYQPIGTGLDHSYRYAINELARSDHPLGPDGGLELGPLGYLLVPLDLGNNLTRAITLWLAVHLLFAACVLDAARRTPDALRVVAFSIVYVGAAALGLPYAYHLLVVLALLATAAIRAARLPDVPAVIAGILAAVGLFMKLTLGIAALSIVMTGALALWTRPDERGRRAALASGAVYLLTVFVLSGLLFDSRAGFYAWIANSFEVISGFGSAMSLSAHRSVLVCGIVATVVVLGSAFLLRRREHAVLQAGVLLAIALLLSFRDGLVRQDDRIVNFFPFVIAVLAVFILVAREPRSSRILVGGAVVSVFVAISSYTAVGIFHPAETARTALGLRGAAHLRALAMIETTREDLRQRSTSNLAAMRLPEDWVTGIRRHGGAIDAFPGEISYAPANELSWDPNPVLQSHIAYTAALDHKSAEQYGEIGAPAFVIAEYKTIDGRHPLLDAPATVRELLQNYALMESEVEPARLLLRHVGPRFADTLAPTLSESADIGEWIDVPRSDRLLFVELDLQLSTRGRVSATVFRVAPVSVEIVYADGRNEAYRIVPATARNGLLMNYLPPTLDDLARLFLGSASNRVEKFRIVESGAAMYEPLFVITWREADYRVASPTLIASH